MLEVKKINRQINLVAFIRNQSYSYKQSAFNLEQDYISNLANLHQVYLRFIP